MAYRFRRGESAAEAIRRIAGEEAGGAIGKLSTPEAIHETRKSIKKLRALVRLVRPEIGDEVFRQLNTAFRDVGQKLSLYRDAEALLETFDKLRPGLQELDRAAMTSLRRRLAARKKQLHGSAELAQHRAELVGVLKGTLEQMEKLPIESDGFGAIEEGFEDTYRAGRVALKKAEKRPSPENLHDWRKRVKDHWYHIRLIEDVWTPIIPAYETALKELETLLGDDHNLVLLKAAVSEAPDAKAIGKAIGRARKALREKAFASGRRIYEQRPRALTREMGHLWDIWRSDPRPSNVVVA